MEKNRNYYLIAEDANGLKRKIKIDNLKVVTASRGGNYFLEEIDQVTHQYDSYYDLAAAIKEANDALEINDLYITTKSRDENLKPVPVIFSNMPLPLDAQKTYELLLVNHYFLLSKMHGRCAEKWHHSYKSYWDDASERSSEYFYQKLHAKQVSESYLLRRDFTLTNFASKTDNEKYLYATLVNNNGFMMKAPMYINVPLIDKLEKPVLVKESATEGRVVKEQVRVRHDGDSQMRLF